MENNSKESNQNTNDQPQNQGQAYPQNAPPQNQAPKDPQLQRQKSLLYQQAENLEQTNVQAQLQQAENLEQTNGHVQPQQAENLEQTNVQAQLQQAENLEQTNMQVQPQQAENLEQLNVQPQQSLQQMQQPYIPYQPIYASQNANAGVLPEEPISFSDWMITFVLLCIPVINIIFLFLWAFGKHSKKSKENYAKAALVWVFIWTLIGFTIFTVFWGIINGTL